LRIVPAYWVALTITALWVGTSALQYGVFTAHGAPLYYLLGQTYSPHTLSGGLTQAWTLTIEVAFYAFLPGYAWIQRRIPARTRAAALRSEIIGLLVLIVISTVWKAVILGDGNSHQIVVTPLLDALPSYFDQFAFGMGLALLSVWIELEDTTPRFVRVFDRFPGIAWLFAAVAFWFVATQIGLGGFFAPVNTHQYMESHWLYTAVALGLLLPAVVSDQARGVPRRILRWPVLAWLGLISYGIYLWQIPVVAQLSRWHFGTHSVLYPWLWWSAGTLALTAVIAAASYYLLERPILSFKHVFDKRPVAARGEATDEPAPARPLALVPDRGDQS
jgi:peptidoglycan/LPS O-acetylase OafA/YrhL